jgi:hypothetical protein
VAGLCQTQSALGNYSVGHRQKDLCCQQQVTGDLCCKLSASSKTGSLRWWSSCLKSGGESCSGITVLKLHQALQPLTNPGGKAELAFALG